MLRTREWARRYCDMLDGAEEAPTVNELYKAIELDEDDLVKDAFVQVDRYTDQSMKEAMKWRMAYYHERGKVGDLQDEVNWLNAELHGAELKAARAERTCHRMTADDVRRLIERYSDEGGGNWRDFHNGAYVAIADELNTRAERTCQEVEVTSRYQPYVTYMTACSLCGGTLAVEEYPAPNYCPNCGARVVE